MTRPYFAAPLRVDFAASRGRPSDVIVRAVIASAKSACDPAMSGPEMIAKNAERIAQKIYADDAATLALLAKNANALAKTRSATTPAMTTQSGWAAELAGNAVADLVVGMGPDVSAASELFRNSIRLTFSRNAVITAPGIVAAATGIGFVPEGGKIPIRQFLIRGPKLKPGKLPIGVMFTQEMFDTPNAEPLVRLAITESLAVDLDALLFDEQPESATRPAAGLRYNVAALTPKAGGGEQARDADIGAVLGAVAPVGGSRVALVCSPDTYNAVMSRPNAEKYPALTLQTSALEPKTILAVALNALAVATRDQPRFEIANKPLIHGEDSAPVDIGTAGTPNVVAAPAVSVWQTDCLVLRLIIEMGWALRAPGSVAWIENVTW